MQKSIDGGKKPPKKDGTPHVYSIIRKCVNYGIEYAMMVRLNYQDLLGLLVEYDIQTLLDYKKRLAEKENSINEFDVRDATVDDFKPMKKRGD